MDRGAPTAVLARAAVRAERCDRLLIGVGPVSPLSAALDLTVTVGESSREGVTVVDPEQVAGQLCASVAAHPQAAIVLGRVLRSTATLDVPDALDVESFAYSTLLAGPEFLRWLENRGPRELPPAADDPVLVRRTDDRLHVTLNRPARRNAYGRELRAALGDALRLALLDPTLTRVVLDGAGPAFCAGGDLAEFGTAPDPVTAHFVRTSAGAGRLVHALRDRIEVRVHGSCVGAGVELPALAGRVIASADATFRLPETGMGLIPGAGGTVGIPRRIGRWRTLYLALSDQPLPATTALDWGLVDGIT